MTRREILATAFLPLAALLPLAPRWDEFYFYHSKGDPGEKIGYVARLGSARYSHWLDTRSGRFSGEEIAFAKKYLADHAKAMLTYINSQRESEA